MVRDKEELIESAFSLCESCIKDLLKIVRNDSVRVTIVSDCPIEQFACFRLVALNGIQKYTFGLKNKDNISEIPVYEKHMSTAYSGTSFTFNIKEGNSINSIVSFLVSKMIFE